MKLLPNQIIRPVSFALAMVLGFVVAYLAWADAGLTRAEASAAPLPMARA